MADNYCLSSSKLMLEVDEVKRAQAIVDRAVKDIEDGKVDDWDCCGCRVVVEDDGVWFVHDESINVNHVEYIARALIDELAINEPFFVSWAYICTKPRIDEFGGGAFVIKRGYKTFWVNAMEDVREMVSWNRLKKLDT